MERMQTVMNSFRSSPPSSIAGIAVQRLRDYKNTTVTEIGQENSEKKAFVGPQSDMIFLDLAIPHHSIAIRPSGTEPKLKIYASVAADNAENAKKTTGKPSAIVIKTVKGKGVSFMENDAGWHGKAPNDAEYAQAMTELKAQLAELEA
jgi:phosphomannomutase